jgi:hypothetical protein
MKAADSARFNAIALMGLAALGSLIVGGALLAVLVAPAVSVPPPQVRPVVFGFPLPLDPADGPADDEGPTAAVLSEKLHEFFDRTYGNLYAVVIPPSCHVHRACDVPVGEVFDFKPKLDQVSALGPVTFTVTDVVPADLPSVPGVDANVNITGPTAVAGVTHPCEFRLENGWKLKYQDAYDLLIMTSNAANAN